MSKEPDDLTPEQWLVGSLILIGMALVFFGEGQAKNVGGWLMLGTIAIFGTVALIRGKI